MQRANHTLTDNNNQLEKLSGDLSESNTIKEIYIGNYMTLCSDYINKLDKYRLKVNQMLMAKSYEKLMDLTKSNVQIESEIQEFYRTFDNTFLNIYPNFCETVNQLLQDDYKIELKPGEILNTELRILALIRLGIKDSGKIAHLLRYSVNTIYNYRVKLKNKAKGERELFEDQVAEIGNIESAK
jgi:hypothetical protein